jgi:hypothetical protein
VTATTVQFLGSNQNNGSTPAASEPAPLPLEDEIPF